MRFSPRPGFACAACGLVYELLASTIASYLLGDSVTQFSTVIGTYLFAMGIGSWCSRYVRRDPLRLFIRRDSGPAAPPDVIRARLLRPHDSDPPRRHRDRRIAHGDRGAVRNGRNSHLGLDSAARP